MKLILAAVARNFHRRSSYFRHFGPSSSSFACCPAPRSFSSDSGHDDSKKSSASKVGDLSKKLESEKSDDISKSAKVDENSELQLTKPGGMGKAGELRKFRESESQLGDVEGKKKRRPLKSATAKDEDESSTSDDELMSSESSSDDEPKEKDKPSQILTPTIRHAVKDVSKSLGGDERRTRLDLLKKLMKHEQESYQASKIDEGDQKEEKAVDAKKSTTKLGSLLGGMKVQKEERQGRPASQGMLRASDQVVKKYKKFMKEADESRDQPGAMVRKPMEKAEEAKQYARTDFFDRGPGLGIFIPVADKLKSSPPLLPVWENLERRRLKQLVALEPRNGFEELIRWTEEGKTHPYPIDNDYGHVEQNVPFHEHVFLDDQLEDGFAKTGPIRHFMELVVHGLSSNPYMSVEKKHEHIAWFREYFQKRGGEIEKLHALDLKHQQALAEIDAAAGKEIEAKAE